MAERVGALRYDVLLNTVDLDRGAKKTNSSIKTLRKGFKGLTKPAETFSATMKDYNVHLGDGSLTPEDYSALHKQELGILEKKGFQLSKNGKFDKTEVQLLKDKIALETKLQEKGKLQLKLARMTGQEQRKAFIKRRDRGAEEHQKLMGRYHQRQRMNSRLHTRAMLDTKELAGNIRRKMSGMSGGMQAGVLGNLAGSMGASGAMIGGIRGATMLGAKYVLPVAMIAGFGLAMKKAAENAHELRKATIDLSVLMGNSDEAAGGLIKKFQALARATPLTTQTLAQGARQLMSFGRESRFLVRDLTALGTIAGGDVNRMKLLTKAFGDVTAAGKLQGQELRQFTNQGWNPLRKMVDQTGLSYDQLRKKMEAGQVSIEMVTKALYGSADQYAGRLEKAMDTVGGQWGKLKGILFEISTTPGTPVESGAAGVLKGINYAIENFEKGADYIGKTGANFMDQMHQYDERTLKWFQGMLGMKVEQRSDRFGRMTPWELENWKKKEAADIKNAVALAAFQKGITSVDNAKEMDELYKLTQDQLDLMKDLDDKFFGFSRFDRMRNNFKVERDKLAMTAEDYKTAIDNVNKLEKVTKRVFDRQQQLKKLKDAPKVRHKEAIENIEKEAAAKKKTVEDQFKREKEIAAALKVGGGPSDDFTAGGADYRFIQQRRGEMLSRDIENQADKKRESQNEQIIGILKDLREIEDNKLLDANNRWERMEASQ